MGYAKGFCLEPAAQALLPKAIYTVKEWQHKYNIIDVWLDQSVDGGSEQTARAPACRMQRLKEVLDMRERCIAQLQDKLREQQAQHAQVSCPILL